MKTIIINHINYPNDLNLPREFAFPCEVEFDYDELIEALLDVYVVKKELVLHYLNWEIYEALTNMIDEDFLKLSDEELAKTLFNLGYEFAFADFTYSHSFDAKFLFQVYLDLEKRIDE